MGLYGLFFRHRIFELGSGLGVFGKRQKQKEPAD